MKKKFVVGIVMILTLWISLFVTAYANDDITIYVNEQVLNCENAPFIKEGRVMVPMRKIFEALDTKVDWESSTKTITATKDSTQIILQINNPIMYCNGVGESLDVSPIIVGSSTFVPIRAVSQSLNASVEWIEDIHTVYINSPYVYSKDYSDIYTKVTMYALDGRSITVSKSQISAYENAGWYLTPPTTMYALDGRSIVVADSEVSVYENVGWYRYPVTMMYSLDGRTMVVANSEIGEYQNVGWYLNPVTTMYAADGRTIVVNKDEVDAYTKVGWYKTHAEAQAAKAPTKSSNSEQSNSGGGTVYRTPTGKRYHYDPDCGGKNSYQTTLQKAKSAGLTPCKKCV